MTLPPLANLLAIRDQNPDALMASEQRLRADPGFAETWRPHPTWVIAVAPLQGGAPDPPEVRTAGLAFAEGRGALLDIATAERRHLLQRLTDDSPERLRSLPGDFGFIRVRPDGGATIVRSCGGLVPFFLCASDRRLLVATRLDLLVRYLSASAEIDPLVAATWVGAAPMFPDDRTPIAGVRVLPRGCLAVAEPEGPPKTRRYWDPRPDQLQRPTVESAREHAARLRSILSDSLERELDPSGGNLLTLSGGVDSSALAALARHLGRPVATLSFLPTDPSTRARETSSIQALAEEVGFERQWSFDLSTAVRLEMLETAPDAGLPIPHPALGVLPRIAREFDVRVLFGGEFADEVCGSAYTFPDWVSHTPALRLIAGLGHLPTGWRDVLRWGKRRATSAIHGPEMPYPARLASVFHADVRAEYQEWFNRRRRAVAEDRRPLQHLSARLDFDAAVTMNWEVASAMGVRRAFPFFSRAAIELAYDCHPEEMVGPGTKRVLRAALAGLVPEAHLERGKATWSSGPPGGPLRWNETASEELGLVFDPDWMAVPRTDMQPRDVVRLAILTRWVRSLANLRRS